MTTYAPVRQRPLPRVPIDPRIRERRVAVKREAGRRRLRKLAFVIGLAVVTAAAGAALFSPLLDVDAIAVAGVGGARADEVRDAAGVSRGEPTLLVDTGDVEARVESLSWVEHATATRGLPGTLRISVTPRVAVGWTVDANERTVLVDGHGRVIEAVDDRPAGLPELTGRTAKEPRATTLAARVAAALPESARAGANAVTVVGGQATVILASGTHLRLGSGRSLAEKVPAALAILEARGDTPTTYVDVRVPSAAAAG